jgi:hypothetical protein
MKSLPFEIVVGNIGYVWSGSNYMQASSQFARWVKDSKTGLGRSGGESVTLFHNGEVKKEYPGTLGNSSE